MAVSTRTHFDMSLQRMLYNSALNKAITTERTCQRCDCGKAPMYMLLTYTSFKDCDCVFPTYSKYLKTIGVAAAINNLQMRVNLVYTETPCYYKSNVLGNFGVMELHNNPTCTDLYSSVSFSRIENTVLLLETCVYVLSYVRVLPGNAYMLFRGDIIYAEGDHCGETEETAANIAIDCVTNVINHDASPCYPIIQSFLAPWVCGNTGIAHVGVPG